MEHDTSAFSKSVSMPLLQQQTEQHNAAVNGKLANEQQYSALQHSPGFQDYRNQAADMWSPDRKGFPRHLSSLDGDQNDLETNGTSKPPASEKIMRRGLDMNGNLPTLTTFGSPDCDMATVPEQKNRLKTRFSSASPRDIPIDDGPVFEAEPQHGIYVSAGPLPWEFNLQKPILPSPRLPSGGSTFLDHGSSLDVDTADFQGCKTQRKYWLSGLEPRSPVTDTFSPLKDIFVPDGFLQHRREPNRLLHLPVDLSLQHPISYNDDQGSDVPGLLSPVYTSPGQGSRFETSQKIDLHTIEVLTSCQGSKFYSASGTDFSHLVSAMPYLPSRDQYKESEAKKTPQLDLRALKMSNNLNYSAYHELSSGLGPGHGRTITDPFIEHADRLDKSPTLPSTISHATQKFTFPSTLRTPVPVRPDFQFPGTPTTQFYLTNKDMPTYQDFIPTFLPVHPIPSHIPAFQPSHSTTLITPYFQTSTIASPRVDLPIPPPPLPSVQGELSHTPETRARLDAQAAIRADWIRTEAKKIAELSCLSFTAARQFNETGLQDDYERWQKLAAEYDEATNSEKRQEQRRKMFMSESTRVMKTGMESIVNDQSVSFDAANGGAGYQEKKKLLGFQIAYMERVYAEVMLRTDEDKEEDGAITAELLDTLSLEEKKDFKRHLVARLEASAACRD